MAWSGVHQGGQGVQLRVGIVGEHAGGENDQLDVLVGGIGIRRGHRCRIGRRRRGSGNPHVIEQQIATAGKPAENRGGIGERQRGRRTARDKGEALRGPLGRTRTRRQIKRSERRGGSRDIHLHSLLLTGGAENSRVEIQGIGRTGSGSEGLGNGSAEGISASVEHRDTGGSRIGRVCRGVAGIRDVAEGAASDRPVVQRVGPAAGGVAVFKTAVEEEIAGRDDDREGNSRHIGVRGGVIRLVGERVGAGVSGCRRVGESAVRIKCEDAVCRAGHQNRVQRIRISIRIIRENTGSPQHRQGDILARGIGIVDRDGCRVGTRHRHPHVVQQQVTAGCRASELGGKIGKSQRRGGAGRHEGVVSGDKLGHRRG